ncbi:MAG: peptidoglycan -binding protein [Acidiferrobacterales bacterium]
MFALSRRSRHGINVWPGFVDALASILLVFIFVVLIFVLAQFFLKETLVGRESALDQLSRQINELADTLSLEREKSTALGATIADLSTRLTATLAERDALNRRLALTAQRAQAAESEAAQLQARLGDAEATIAVDKERIELQLRELASLQQDIAALRQVRDDLEGQVGELAAGIKQRDTDLLAARDRSKALETRLAEAQERTRLAQVEIDKRDIRLREFTKQSRSRLQVLNQQISALREQLSQLSAALALAETQAKEQKVEIAALGKRLNVALARRVQKLNRYRSEFFGRLREVLGDHPDIRIVGDRFVFQSELLFPTASATLLPAGRKQLAQLAQTLRSVTRTIPADIDWVLRVDGHTDRRPIHSTQYPSNWELSTARALSVVNYLIAQGIAPKRLVAAGLGEFRPLDDRYTDEAYARNRRIEIKLTGP